MYYQIKSYIKFLLSSSNAHGIHSPFVYELLTNCFYDKAAYPQYTILNQFRQNLLRSSETIEITDFGQGSRVFKSNRRKIAAIAKNAGISSKRQRLLFRLVRYFKAENILELGTSLGLATVALSLGNSSAKVVTVEGCQNTSERAQRSFDQSKLKNVELHSKTFENFFSKNTSEAYDLVFIDGNHNKEKTLQYFELLLKKIKNDSILIFDDIYWSPEMTEAWRQICKHPDVCVSIDTFYWGIAIFRKEQAKEHFIVRL